jgi:hypothetical protein
MKQEVIRNWRRGDSAEIARRMKDIHKITISPEAVQAWRKGRNGSRVEWYLIETAQQIQSERNGNCKPANKTARRALRS